MNEVPSSPRIATFYLEKYHPRQLEFDICHAMLTAESEAISDETKSFDPRLSGIASYKSNAATRHQADVMARLELVRAVA
ncbi:MAG: hypothetical protein MZV70_55415 [Desulfobacterales bacterium]|nr:hypothetical protein [Desulfobacterales bacterium]